MSEFLNGIEVPRFISHKEVHALEIERVESVNPPVRGATVVFADERFGSIECEAKMFARYVPVRGDFFVFYEDGYKSFSPRKSFEEGYTEKK